MSTSFKTRPALVADVTCGDPDIATPRDIVLAAADAGACVIELGVPFSDPVADGPVIQRATDRALRQGTSVKHVFELARDLRKQSDVGLIIFSYLNPVLRFGYQKFADACHENGLDGALITDLPVEEAQGYLKPM